MGYTSGTKNWTKEYIYGRVGEQRWLEIADGNRVHATCNETNFFLQISALSQLKIQ